MYALQAKYVQSTQLAAGESLPPNVQSNLSSSLFSYQSSHFAIAWLQSQQNDSNYSTFLQACLVFP